MVTEGSPRRSNEESPTISILQTREQQWGQTPQWPSQPTPSSAADLSAPDTSRVHTAIPPIQTVTRAPTTPLTSLVSLLKQLSWIVNQRFTPFSHLKASDGMYFSFKLTTLWFSADTMMLSYSYVWRNDHHPEFSPHQSLNIVTTMFPWPETF